MRVGNAVDSSEKKGKVSIPGRVLLVTGVIMTALSMKTVLFRCNVTPTLFGSANLTKAHLKKGETKFQYVVGFFLDIGRNIQGKILKLRPKNVYSLQNTERKRNHYAQIC